MTFQCSERKLNRKLASFVCVTIFTYDMSFYVLLYSTLSIKIQAKLLELNAADYVILVQLSNFSQISDLLRIKDI